MLEAFCNIAEMGRRYRAYRRWYFIYTQVPQRRRNRELQALHQRLTHLEEENAALRRHLQVVEEHIRLLMEETEF
jgi:transposase